MLRAKSLHKLKYLFLALLVGCASTKTASFYYTQKQVEAGDLDFHMRLRVDEYLNAFKQDALNEPRKGEDAAASIAYFQTKVPAGADRTLVQIAVKTRKPSAEELKKDFGICVVFDVSGSMMEWNKLEDSREALASAVRELKDGTQFSIVTFSDDAKLYLEPTILDSANREQVIEKIRAITAWGSTNIQAGLVLGYKTLAGFGPGRVSRLVLLTDGQSTVGVTRPEELAREARTGIIDGARISAIGLGHDVDDKTLRTIAEHGSGHYYFADNAKTLTRFFREDFKA